MYISDYRKGTLISTRAGYHLCPLESLLLLIYPYIDGHNTYQSRN